MSQGTTASRTSERQIYDLFKNDFNYYDYLASVNE